MAFIAERRSFSAVIAILTCLLILCIESARRSQTLRSLQNDNSKNIWEKLEDLETGNNQPIPDSEIVIAAKPLASMGSASQDVPKKFMWMDEFKKNITDDPFEKSDRDVRIEQLRLKLQVRKKAQNKNLLTIFVQFSIPVYNRSL